MPTKELSSAELHLWNIVENNPEKIATMSIVKLSQLANVSTATIVRTMKKMGYSGYTSYRESLKLKKNLTLLSAYLMKQMTKFVA